MDFELDRGAARRAEDGAPSSRTTRSCRRRPRSIASIAIPTELVDADGRARLPRHRGARSSAAAPGFDTVATCSRWRRSRARARRPRVIMSVQQLAGAAIRSSSSAPTRRSSECSRRSQRASCSAASRSASPRPAATPPRRRRPPKQDGGGWRHQRHEELDHQRPASPTSCVLFAMTDRRAGHKGITAFIVPMKTQGRAHRPARQQARHPRLAVVRRSSSTRSRCPGDAVLGEVGGGFKVAMSTLDGGRIGIAAQALGIARAALEDALAYASERKTFGKPIAQHQAIQFKLADMATRDRRRAPARAGARRGMKDRGVRHTRESRRWPSCTRREVANRARHEAMQIFGGNGYVDGVPRRAPLPRRARSPKSTKARARSSGS